MNRQHCQQHRKTINPLLLPLLAIVLSFAFPIKTSAQMFGDESDIVDSSLPKPQVPQVEPTQPAQPRVAPRNANRQPQVRPQNNNTQVNRQNSQVRTVTKRQQVGKQEEEKKQKIYLYAKDFKISRTLNKSINCRVRFYIKTTIDENISNISYRLKWEDMETTLTFDGVKPNTATYHDYSLLGKGCYNMDKAPNIIVNRCRIKGMTQRECANLIEWVK